ncbi:MAG: outer membrane protein assembly factor BamD [Gallionella sp.]|nr:outer membrane protein assembly factor BamD [Gallionella sp.]
MRPILAVFMLLTLTACSMFGSKPAAQDSDKTTTADSMYQEARQKLDKNDFESAIKKLESLQSRYPYGRYAQQAQLDLAYAYYRQDEPESAISAADTFIKQYPNNPHVDYAYYVKGLANFNPGIGNLSLTVGEDPSERDPQSEHDSFDAFKDLVTRFPSSKYAPDARLRMQYLLDSLAKYEIHVAKYYLRRGADVAAVNRAKEVLTEYPDSPSVEDALQVLVKGYGILGLNKLRDDAQRVLSMNFPRAAVTPGKLNDRSR